MDESFRQFYTDCFCRFLNIVRESRTSHRHTSIFISVVSSFHSFPSSGESYTVGQTEDISLEIKPTSHTGLLLSSSNKKGDYIVLEMIRGDVSSRA